MYTYKIFDSVTEECENIFKDKKNIQYSNFFKIKNILNKLLNLEIAK